jgi:hypothetical protein
LRLRCALTAICNSWGSWQELRNVGELINLIRYISS